MLFTIKNFRAIENQEIELAPITVVTGANSAGKSSLLYALITLRTAILSSNSAVPGFFNYGFASLGGYEQVVFDHKIQSKMELTLRVDVGSGMFVEHGVTLGESQGGFRLHARLGDLPIDIDIPSSFPYAGNQPITTNLTIKEQAVAFTWNGITAQVPAGQVGGPEVLDALMTTVSLLNAPVELLRRAAIIPLKRGFSKPVYQTQSVSASLVTEDEVATFLSNNKYLVSKVSHYLEKVLGQDFRVNFTPGTGIFSLDATDRKTGVATELVNEGFGVNQMVYLLAKALNADTTWSCVEEPEIHLHPSAVRGFARILADIVRDENKRFILSTHSEALVSALLSMVAEGKLKPEELAFYYVKKEGKRAVYERQRVHETGQIEGGLTSFIEGEMQDVRSMLKRSEVSAQ